MYKCQIYYVSFFLINDKIVFRHLLTFIYFFCFKFLLCQFGSTRGIRFRESRFFPSALKNFLKDRERFLSVKWILARDSVHRDGGWTIGISVTAWAPTEGNETYRNKFNCKNNYRRLSAYKVGYPTAGLVTGTNYLHKWEAFNSIFINKGYSNERGKTKRRTEGCKCKEKCKDEEEEEEEKKEEIKMENDGRGSEGGIHRRNSRAKKGYWEIAGHTREENQESSEEEKGGERKRQGWQGVLVAGKWSKRCDSGE